MDVLAEYGVGKGIVKTPHVEKTNYLTSLEGNTDLPAYLTNLVKTGVLQPNKNSFYPIHLSPTVNVTLGGVPVCPNYCNYMGWVWIGSFYPKTPYIYYSVIPDQTGACKDNCGYSPNPLSNTQALASVQLVNTLTNPLQRGWYYGVQYQSAARMSCSWRQYPLKDLSSAGGKIVTVQRVWSNKYQAVSLIGPIQTFFIIVFFLFWLVSNLSEALC
ncbi:hypothetical protein BDR26DRAFT_668390 [Obelidium mucronatum]|nr:hypothetical protein BDR26DRAFT_668390 [Obelidium mucronatum]